MRIIFAGTPDFAAVALQALADAGHEIPLVLTQPDRPSGRGMKLTPSPVKVLAQKLGIEVATPFTLSLKKDPDGAAAMHARLKSLNADLLVVAAYGLILPLPVLDCAKGIGKFGDIKALNIHASLLPRWRGAAPIARAIEAGDAETGVTLMKMELGLDTGPMVAEARTPILAEDTTATLTERLASMGANLLVQSLQHANELIARRSLTRVFSTRKSCSKAKNAFNGAIPLQSLLEDYALLHRSPDSNFTEVLMSSKSGQPQPKMPIQVYPAKCSRLSMTLLSVAELELSVLQNFSVQAKLEAQRRQPYRDCTSKRVRCFNDGSGPQ